MKTDSDTIIIGIFLSGNLDMAGSLAGVNIRKMTRRTM
jgi:hypothetical protein